jgi:uncharacterized repeat protein (TIGR03803 family)
MTPGGMLTTLHSFDLTDGEYPYAGLVQATDGNFYGTTYGTFSEGDNYGTVFEINSSGTLNTLHNFCSQTNCADGASPMAGLVQATDGNFYGTTEDGGDEGTAFEITPGGVLTALHDFFGPGGEFPIGGVVQGTNGIFYGTTPLGGTDYGTVYSLSVGLGQFVETNPTSGKVGAAVRILGSFLTGATSVTFDGTSATFTVNSKSEITTTVPAGATTGTVQVVTPRLGALSSNVPFTVRP